MPDLFPVTSSVAFGRAPRDARAVGRLVQAGITHVIDCSGSRLAASLIGRHLVYAAHPIADSLEDLPPWWFESAGRWALRILDNPANHLLICCAQARRRSPALAYWTLRAQGTSADDAQAAIRMARPSVSSVYFASADAAVDRR